MQISTLMGLTLEQLAKRIGADLVGSGADGEVVIDAVGAIETAGDRHVTFVSRDKHRAEVRKTGAAAVIVSEPIESLGKPQLVVKEVDSALIEALKVFAPVLSAPAGGVDPSARVADRAKIDKTASVGPHTVIGPNVKIGKNCVISGGCHIGEGSSIGENCRLDSNVVIYHNCRIGNNVIIQANTTIGSTGFGYTKVNGESRLIPHNGGVLIEDCVEIGANCCIDRAKFGNTVVGAGTKMDNLVQIGHNVVIGKCCLIAGQVGIAGSAKVGDGVVMAGQVGVADNLYIGSGAVLTAKAGVLNDVESEKVMTWIPALEHSEALRAIANVMRLPKLAAKIRTLGQRVDKLESAEDD